MKLGIESVGPGKKYDEGKTRVDLLPVGALQAVAQVLTFGANKYGSNNWQNVRPLSRYYGAAIRHLYARARGEKTDPESGLPHLAHAACCVLFLLSGEVGHDNPEAFEPEPAKDLFDEAVARQSASAKGTYSVTFECADVKGCASGDADDDSEDDLAGLAERASGAV